MHLTELLGDPRLRLYDVRLGYNLRRAKESANSFWNGPCFFSISSIVFCEFSLMSRLASSWIRERMFDL